MNMKPVDDGETCCHCEPLPTTTTIATTTTPMATKTSCPLECVVDITCEDEADFRMGTRQVPFLSNETCTNLDCDCPDSSAMDTFWDSGMCVRMNEQCEKPCVVDGVQYAPGDSFERDCRICTCEYDVFMMEKCTFFCNVTMQECQDEGKVLQNNHNECCSCVDVPTTTEAYVPTTTSTSVSSTTSPAEGTTSAPTEETTPGSVVPEGTTPGTPSEGTTPGSSEGTTSVPAVEETPSFMSTIVSTMSSLFTASDVTETTAAVTSSTTSSPVVCSENCTCKLGCDGEQDECVEHEMCTEACVCSDENAVKVNGLCASWPSSDECSATTTSATRFTTKTPKPKLPDTTTSTAASTTSAAVTSKTSEATTSVPSVEETTPAASSTTRSSPVEGTTSSTTETTEGVMSTTEGVEGTTPGSLVEGTTP